MSKIIKIFNQIGPCTVDVDLLEKQWDHRFFLTQWEDTYRLIQYLRRGSGITKLKCSISNEQAQEIINRLQLVREQGMFTSSGTWSKAGFSEFDILMKRKKK